MSRKSQQIQGNPRQKAASQQAAKSQRMPASQQAAKSQRMPVPQQTARSQRVSNSQQTARSQRTSNSRPTANSRSISNSRPVSASRPVPAAATARASSARAYAASPSRPSTNRVSREKAARGQKRGFTIVFILLAIAIAAVIAVSSNAVTVTVNGQQVGAFGEQSIASILPNTGVNPTPGNMLSVEGEVIRKGGGSPMTIKVNGEDFGADDTVKVKNGDVIEISDGQDQTEPSSTVEEPVSFTISKEGKGAVHLITQQGEDGLNLSITGNVSGKTIQQVASDMKELTCKEFDVDTGGEKVIALTFDDGPHKKHTAEILDVLAENDAKATFFTIGQQITGEGSDLVSREASEGHQVCTHTFDHAEGSGRGVNLGYMSAAEQVEEVQKGLDAIKAVTGAEASKVIRTPGGNFGDDVIANIGPLIDAEINWNIDTLDWKRPGADSIASKLLSAEPGSIILMHDGGGDRSQTTQALRQALPKLAEKGFRFVTIDELLTYAK